MPKSTPPRNKLARPQAASHGNATYQDKKRGLEYAAIALSGLAFIAAASAACFNGWQAWTASDTEERQLRAYLYTLPGSNIVEQRPDGSIRVVVKPAMKVFGQTPAGMVLPGWDLKIGDNPIPANFPFSVGAGQATATMSPGEVVSIAEMSLEISKENVLALKADKKRVYQAGTIIFIDVFSKARYTNFCRGANFDGLIQGSWVLCPIHNGADWYSGRHSNVTMPHD